jgi:hypothetical protein
LFLLLSSVQTFFSALYSLIYSVSILLLRPYSYKTTERIVFFVTF